MGLAVVLIILSVLGYAYLPQAGEYLAVKPVAPGHAELLVVLGGGWDDRVVTARALLASGLANKVLLTAAATTNRDQSKLLDHRYKLLIRGGVPGNSIYLDTTARSTWQDVNVILDLMKKMHWRNVLIVSDPPHMRRLEWVCGQLLDSAGIKYELVPTQPPWWDEMHWWRNALARKFVLEEYVKLIVYRLAYSKPLLSLFGPLWIVHTTTDGS